MSMDMATTFKKNNDNLNGAFITMPIVYIAVNKMATFIIYPYLFNILLNSFSLNGIKTISV